MNPNRWGTQAGGDVEAHSVLPWNEAITTKAHGAQLYYVLQITSLGLETCVSKAWSQQIHVGK